MIVYLAVLLSAFSAWAGELTTGDLIVTNNATIYGNLNFYTIAGTTNGSNVYLGDGLLTHWKMNDNAANTTVADSSANANTGTAYANTQGIHVDGKIGGALSFDGGNNEWIESTYNCSIYGLNGNPSLTIAAWIRNNATSNGWLRIVGWGQYDGDGTQINLGYNPPNDHKVCFTRYYRDLKSGITDTNWHHYVGTYDAGTGLGIFYVDGIEVTRDTGFGPQYIQDTKFYVGGHGGWDESLSFRGSVDDVRIYNRPITSNEVSAIYNGGAGTENALISSNITTLTISSNGINQANSFGVNTFMGKVGIGTNNPVEKLHVAGNMQVDGSLKLGGETRTNWPVVGVATGTLLSANNLSDINAGAARTNLGLGTAATMNEEDFDPAGAAASAAGVVSNLFATHTADFNNPHQVTAAQTGALSTNGGMMNGELTVLNPGGDISMGSYTNQ